MQQVLGGRYRVERLIGRDVLTDIYDATDLTLERRVTMQVLKEELDEEPAVRHLFSDAAQGAASLNHPNIVATLDYGDDGGISYVVTEFVEDPTLADVLQSGPLPPRRVAELGVDLAAALADAHAHGVLHRGLNPRDVFIDPEGEARLSNFGFTRAAERARSLDREARMAEAAHVAPERVRGEPADARTDLYGLGLVLYQAATGRPAAVGASPAELAQQQLEQHPPRPSEVNPNVPRELEAVMARLLAKNRDARLPNAEVALQQLQSLLDSGVFGAEPLAPVGATAPPPPPVAHDEYDEEYYETEEPIAAAAAAAAAGQGHIVRIGANDSTTVLPGAPPYRYDQRRQTPWVLWAGLALVVLVIILVVVALSGGGGGTSTVTVPVVLNKTQDDAIAALTKAGLNAKTVSIPNDTVAAGIVYASDPGAGQKVAKHSTVSLSVSSGPVETSTTEAPTTVPPTTARHTTTTRRRVTTTRPRVTTTVRTVPRTTTAPATTTTASSTPPVT